MSADTPPPAKKSEMIEVRVSHETKRDFLAACRRQGRTASEVIREALQDYISGEAAGRFPHPAPAAARPLLSFIPGPLRRRRYLAITAAAAGLSVLAALPSAAQPDGVPSCARFQHLDTNHDGRLAFEEFGSP